MKNWIYLDQVWYWFVTVFRIAYSSFGTLESTNSLNCSAFDSTSQSSFMFISQSKLEVTFPNSMSSSNCFHEFFQTSFISWNDNWLFISIMFIQLEGKPTSLEALFANSFIFFIVQVRDLLSKCIKPWTNISDQKISYLRPYNLDLNLLCNWLLVHVSSSNCFVSSILFSYACFAKNAVRTKMLLLTSFTLIFFQNLKRIIKNHIFNWRCSFLKFTWDFWLNISDQKCRTQHNYYIKALI